jgi:hypothetical protein
LWQQQLPGILRHLPILKLDKIVAGNTCLIRRADVMILRRNDVFRKKGRQNMKSTPKFSVLIPLVISTLLTAGNVCRAAVGLTISPSTVSNTYSGAITLQISSLTAGDTVVVQKFLDANTNGLVDAGDLPVQQFDLTDGQAGMVIGGVTNINVPGDTDTTAGQITAVLNFRGGDFVQNTVGKYLFKISGNFTPAITNVFTVTNFPFGQQINGTVVSNSAAVSNAVIILFPPPRGGDHGPGTPVAGTVADNSGHYTIQAPPGTYVPLAFQSGYVANFGTSPVLTLGSGQTITTNLMLAAATASISGQIVDAGNSSIGLPGVFMPAVNNSGLIAVGFSDTNGNYTVRVNSGQWNLGSDDGGLIVHGYVGYQNGTDVTAGSTGIVGPYYKATAMFYGSVKDNLGNPLVGIDISAGDNNGSVFQSDGISDANGKYAVGVVGGLGDGDPWQVQVAGDNSPSGYIFSQPQFDQNGGTNLAVGQALKVNFTAILATNHITGNVQHGGTNIVGVNVFASATISNVYYNVQATTDGNGNYSMNATTGNWSVGVDCNGGNSSLDGIIGPGNYLCPSSQFVIITTNNGVANFNIQPCGSIQILTGSPLPGGQVGSFYSTQFDALSCADNFNWSLNSGTLPPGLTLSAGGALNGTPTNSGTFNFSIHVGDGGGNSTNQSYALTIQPATPPTISLPAVFSGGQFQMTVNGSAGQNYTVQMSTNLVSTNWAPLWITNPSSGSFLFKDAGATNPARYYRVLLGP